MTLDEIGLYCGTDKGSKNHNYLRHYEELFRHRQHERLTVLELGVFNGASLVMWADYFPYSQIVGIDIEAPCKQHEDGERIEVRIGSQDDEGFLRSVVEEFGGPDIVIDDASHDGDASRASFEILYPHLKPGGFYIVEDLHTAYFGWGSSFVHYTTRELLEKVVWPGGRVFSHGHGDPRNHPQWGEIKGGMDEFSRQTKSITFLSSLIVFEKWPESESFE